jgi:TetR/AcrR family transcriptional repressor of nem operon
MTTRERLVQSAQELLWERGYVAMSPKAVQERSGAGQGSMYHHFQGKADLAAAAITLSAAGFREGAEKWLSSSGTPLERIKGYMLRSREVMKGCQIGKLTQDPEIASNELLRGPIDETFAWLQERLKGVIKEAQGANEISSELNDGELAAMLIAVIQGGYVLAGASGSAKPFHKAIRGAISLLSLDRPEIAPIGSARRHS